jgi:imidazolonepropionase-like amidohydrolase
MPANGEEKDWVVGSSAAILQTVNPLRIGESLLCLWLGGMVAFGAELLPPGHRPVPPGVHALVGGRVVVQPGEVLSAGTVLIRDGLIEGVGADIAVPVDARVWEMKGMTVYAGFIDLHVPAGSGKSRVSTAMTQPVRDEALTAGGLNFYGVPGQETDPGQRGPGSQLSAIRPERRVAEEYAPDGALLEGLREIGFTVANFVPERGVARGAGVLVSLTEANPNEVILRPEVFQHVAFDARGGGAAAYPRSLMGVIAAVRQAFFDAGHYALDHGHYRDHPEGRRRPPFNPALAALGPVLERRLPVAIEPGSALMLDRAARVARELDVEFLLVASGQEWRRPDLVAATGAALIVPLHFPELSKMPEEADWEMISLDQLRAWDWAPENPALLRAHGLEIALTTHGLGDRKRFRSNLRLALDRGLSEDDALAALTTVPARLCGMERLLGTIEPGKLAHLTIVEGESYFDPETRVRGVWIDGRIHPVRPGKPNDADKPEAEPSETEAELENEEAAEEDEQAGKKSDAKELRKQRTARSPLDGRGPLAEPVSVLVRGATIWTCGPQGRLDEADLLVVGDRIQAVGWNLQLPPDIPGPPLVIEARGQHITPGLIDAHSHSMILGAVNEGTLPSTAMVRIGDVVNSETPNLHLQLAGGLTVANLLHGSANPIGGQNAVIKLRDGAGPDELKFDGAPPGIKFALGENVKQSNWGDQHTTRFPQTRMGVRTFFVNRFLAARQYLDALERHDREGGPPPRRNLELEALGEILRGERWIHCHSYRQDEILMFLRIMEDFGVTIGTLQHVLEGYKVADEIARHGAGASCFSDWWAFKFEVYDAIPHAGSLMRERGVLVSFNSDSSDLARRMNLEAAKAVKYGGTPEEEALKFVTINPARQLRIDDRVGSIEPGKDADFVLWSTSPLDSTTVCLQTWIDGKKYFDREQAAARTAALRQEHADLLDKAKQVLRGGGSTRQAPQEARAAFFERALESARGLHLEACLDCGQPWEELP